MMFDLDSLFRLLNFLALFVFVLYVIYRYGMVSLIAWQRSEKQKREEKAQYLVDIMQQKKDLMTMSFEQENLFVSMKEKFKIWQDKMKQNDSLQQSKAENYIQQIQKKRVIIVKYLQCQKTLQNQMPDLLHEVSIDLQNEFNKNPQQKKEYMSQLLQFVQEK
ncbi:hypothetical protein HYV11_02490 [Candidatus Dependentiae bacterium]|nr:hypothetical protein [Candidatus Dependentiae bacterium]